MTINYLSIFIIFISLSFTAQASTVSCKRPYVIGVQGVDYSPHYNFIDVGQPNFFGKFIDWISLKTGCQFTVRVLPIKRLKSEYEHKNSIDFIYPDNPNWHDKDSHTSNKRSFSSPIAIALGGTIVTEDNENMTISEFRSLAFPRGFTPVAWYAYQEQYPITFTETVNAVSALKMVTTNRVDGADIEFNVAQHLIHKNNLGPLVLAKELPFTPTSFYLSTLTEHEMLAELTTLINRNQKEIIQLKSSLNIIEVID